jgi:hypothetical protein
MRGMEKFRCNLNSWKKLFEKYGVVVSKLICPISKRLMLPELIQTPATTQIYTCKFPGSICTPLGEKMF